MAGIISGNVDVAKELLRKGIALNDPELIAMANSLLKEDVPKNEVEPPKKKRGRKKKDVIEEKEVVAAPVQLDSSSYVTTVRRENAAQKSRIRFTPDGKQEGVYTRSEQVNIKIRPVDSGEFKDDKSNDSLKQFTKPITQMEQRDSGLVTVRCIGGCNREYKIASIHLRNGAYTCDKCIMRRGGM
jgi:hypothetical protein